MREWTEKGFWIGVQIKDKSSEQTSKTSPSRPHKLESPQNMSSFLTPPIPSKVWVTKFSSDTHDKYAAAPHAWLLGENHALPGSQRAQMCQVNRRAEPSPPSSTQNSWCPIWKLCQILWILDSSHVTHTEIQSYKQEKLGTARPQHNSHLQTQRVSQWDAVQVT